MLRPTTELLLHKIDELPDPQNVFEARVQKILYVLEFAIRQLEDRVGELERLRQPRAPNSELNRYP